MDILVGKALGKKTLAGIGPKVADCILLFSLEKMQAFPIDTWMLRTIVNNYSVVIGEGNEWNVSPSDSNCSPNLLERFSIMLTIDGIFELVAHM